MHTALYMGKKGYEIVGVDNINDYYEVSLKYDRLKEQGINTEHLQYNKTLEGKDNIKFVQMDLTDAGNLNNLFAQHRFEYVINLAAQAGVRYSIANPRKYIESNVMGFFNVLEACRFHSVRHLVYASSSSVYGLNAKVPFNESDHTAHQVSLYAASKKSNEAMAHSYSHLYGIPMSGLRFFTVYGPWGRPDMAMFLFTKAVLNGQPIKVFNEGDLYRDFTYIDDIVAGIAGTAERPPWPNSEEFDNEQPNPAYSSAPYRILNIGNSEPVKVLDFIIAIEEVTGKKAQLNFMGMQPGDVKTTYADTSRLKALTQYKPATPIKEGVKKFVDWYVDYYG